MIKLADFPTSNFSDIGLLVYLTACDIDGTADTFNVILNNLEAESKLAMEAQISVAQFLDFVRPHMSAFNLVLGQLRSITEELNDLEEKIYSSEEVVTHG